MNIFTNICLLMSLIFTTGQTQNPVIGSPGLPPLMLVNTLQFRAITSYSIGYLPPQIVGLSNSSACRRVSMFKFPALSTGIATIMTMNVLPKPQPEICDIEFKLYGFSDGIQIGNSFIGSFSLPVSNGGASGGTTNGLAVGMSVNVTRANWLINSGSHYYFSIQTFTWNSAGGRCNMQIPYGMESTKPPVYGLMIQQGPADMPCGATPWTNVATSDGGFIQMSISGNQLSQTPTPSPSAVAAPIVYSSASSTPTSMTVADNSASQTPTPTSMAVVYNSASQTPTPTSTGTTTFWTASGSSSNTGTSSSTPTPTSTPTSSSSLLDTGVSSGTSTPTGTSTSTKTTNSGPLDGSAGIATTPAAPLLISSSSSIIGGSVAGGIIVLLLAAYVTYRINPNFRNTVEKISGIKDVRSPVSSQNIITMNPVNDNTSTYYGQTHV